MKSYSHLIGLEEQVNTYDEQVNAYEDQVKSLEDEISELNEKSICEDRSLDVER